MAELTPDKHEGESLKKISGMYEEWFLDYASYVILERAIPSVHDGFKPVQRRIMHSMREMEDGRYNKVANIVGNTMKYHPHGDMAITDAMVQLGQKGLLIDTQGNWGNVFTGDGAAAARYIEARLTKFALEVIFNPKTTNWQLSYDGRNREPVDLPVKFPLLLAQGVEGIAVGLSTKILPHNFNELIDASIHHLRGKKFILYPDFQTGGMIDVSDYNDGERGGRIRIRAKITQLDKNTLQITEIPYGTNTGTLIESVIKANEKGKIKIKHIEDNTARDVDILVHLAPGTSPDKTIDALYAFTNCEVSVSPNACVIVNNKPEFLSVSEILKINTDNTVNLLKRELEIELGELEDQWHYSSLERIFIENRIYRNIEEETTWEGVISAIDEGLKPFIGHLKREVTQEDIVRLTEIKIKRISKFDLDKAQQYIDSLEGKIAQVQHHLNHLVEYAIAYYQKLKEKYGKEKERLTEIRLFEDIDAAKVAAANVKFYANFEEGFIGTSLKKDEYLFECSDIDDIIAFRRDGTMIVTKVDDKTFIGKNIIHVAVWKKKDKRTTYNLIYRYGKTGPVYQKRFNVTSVIRDKEYSVCKDKEHSEILYFSANPNGEAEVVQVLLKVNSRLKKLRIDINFAELDVKGRSAKGNLVTKYPVKKVELKEEGVSTLAPRKIWFDDAVRRLNAEGRGELLGAFKGSDKILTISTKGVAQLHTFELSNRFDEEYSVLEKWEPSKPITCVYYHSERERYYVKRFTLEDTLNPQEFYDLADENSFIEMISVDYIPVIEIIFKKIKGHQRDSETVNLEEFISVKGISALGNQLTSYAVKEIKVLPPIPYEEPKEEEMPKKETRLFFGSETSQGLLFVDEEE
ncbi:DNA gyrase subunit A [Candidatus Ornithobacterium hominis]|uniref:DNA gyrase subunit A n=1 Tax=Candidatus Ornithobacterium hominis TaxID=2497989 RepID=A0A383TVW1_9FLAO|nr:DNA gyrase/topoisomerase IV subunit A [Candidatus Ornithobacterium hominis]MCT7903626.1 DNA gyrase/topoisomerase IV subunit A [Candidatus Ornithobacterium hominis]SZD70963.1 DNA gyrase subunit A [Candidatus Ornithobacterium hominis]